MRGSPLIILQQAGNDVTDPTAWLVYSIGAVVGLMIVGLGLARLHQFHRAQWRRARRRAVEVARANARTANADIGRLGWHTEYRERE